MVINEEITVCAKIRPFHFKCLSYDPKIRHPTSNVNYELKISERTTHN